MKKLTLLIALAVTSIIANAQQIPATYAPLVKKIEVNGTAEKEVTPDRIFITLALKEYKNGNKKVEMDKLEEQLVKAIKQVGISEDKLQVDNIYGYNWDYRKKKSDDFLETKSFKLEVKDVKMINNLIEKLDPEGVNSVNISEVTHSKIEEFQQELRLQALKNAKAKAKYLAEGIDEKLGGALEIQDMTYSNNVPQPMLRTNFAMKMEAADSYQSNVEFKTIKIKAEVRAVFEIE